MFERTKTFFRWLTGRSKKSDSIPVNTKIAYLIKKNEKVADEFCVCVFKGKELVEVTDQISQEAATQDKELTFWAVTRGNIALLLTVQISPELQFQSEVQIELIPSLGLITLLEGKSLLTQEVLQSVVQSHFAGFTGILQGPISSLTRLDEAGLKQLALKFNLLLNNYGLKCKQFTKFTEVKPDVSPVPTEEVEKELQTAVEPIKTEAAWNEFAKNIQTEGFPATWDSEQMSDLGKKFLENRISAAECVRKIRQLAEEEATKIQNIKLPNEDYWNGLSIRMRLEAEISKNTKENSPSPINEPLEIEVDPSSRPRTGIFWTNQKRLDEKLQGFLKTRLDSIQSVVEYHRNSTQDVRIATELRMLLENLDIIQTILKNAPSLDLHRGPLSTSKDVTPMVQAMNQAVTAAEYLEAVVKSPEVFSSFPLPSELKTTLAKLKNQLELRCQTR